MALWEVNSVPGSPSLKNLPLISIAHQRKQKFSVGHPRPCDIVSCRPVWPPLCDPQAPVKCIDPGCPLPTLKPCSPHPSTLHHWLHTNQTRSLCLWYSHRIGSLVALHNLLSICALALFYSKHPPPTHVQTQDDSHEARKHLSPCTRIYLISNYWDKWLKCITLTQSIHSNQHRVNRKLTNSGVLKEGIFLNSAYNLVITKATSH